MKEYKNDLLRKDAWKAIYVELHAKEYDDNELLVTANGKITSFI